MAYVDMLASTVSRGSVCQLFGTLVIAPHRSWAADGDI